MITKEQAVYLMELIDTIGDASASMEWDLAYAELMTFIGTITYETK
ncbi:hypothetical protein K2_050 [Salmonella phage Kenya-K2]|uniref:Uncharacterized protein n=2 Tax=unclassified Jerseyvirus TaxID=2025810 RepID=A0AAU8GBX2_9CAUD|nr:hypothetical protein K2_050 [Salmonella phage Kenya-K2]WCZ56559.1 hypothetical protein K6_051 [Salmonella phage Kenya-K6]WCZ56625.1 hypothetical protein K9_050 [Salmonella phage Kenya-K9]WCZ56757.1 hypothetical protein K22_050 [Salmonella phage Kenya-K22]WCZ57015.1 hypothetical protein K56_053 [Salmonella phage Kenya-K56]